MNNSKLRVAWICHFSNKTVRDKLPLSDKRKYSDFAPWITNLISAFEKRDDIELHVIAPHMGLKKLTYSFKLNGVFYYFFKPDLPIVHKRWPNFLPLDVWTGFIRNRLLVKKFINKINPDIVNLHGAENHYYSSTVFGIKNLPVYVCIQGIYSNPNRFNDLVKANKQKIKVERKIHSKFKYFGILPPLFADLIKRDNNKPIFLKHKYIPNTQINKIEIKEKKYDFVFFGRVADVKGVDKIIEAIGLINNQGRNVNLNIIGGASKRYLNYLNSLINELDLNSNVFFSGKLSTIEDVHRKVKESKISVLSSKFENMGGALFESVLIDQPVTATAVGGIPYLNKEEETILLSEFGDVRGLADNMLKLLDNPDYANTLTKKCKKFILSEFSEEKLVNRYVKQYKAIIANYHYNTPIPEELLFNHEEFPEY